MRVIVLMLAIIVFSFAIEIDLKPDNNLSVGYEDAQALKDYLYQIYRYRITDQGAYDIVKENRLLANTYLKRNQVSPQDTKYLTIVTEKYLAESFIKKLQKAQNVSDKVLLSYYLDHKDEFKNEDKLYFILLEFPSFNKAMSFYQLAQKKSPQQAIEKARTEYNATIKDLGWKDFSSLKTATKSFIQQGKKEYFLPPFIITSNRIDILYVKDYQEGKGYKKFDEVKDEIKKILYTKAFIKERNKILHQLESKHE